MKEKEKEIQEEADGVSRVYELGYLLVPTLSEDDVPMHYGNIKELVVSLGGEMVADEMPKSITLAYTMTKVIANVNKKFNSAYFGWLKFVMDAQQVVELKKKLDLDHNFIRFFIIKTVKENTIASKKFGRGESFRKTSTRKTQESEPSTPIDKEEIDKEIDALISE